MGFKEEFETVDLIVGSTADTRGVDAFALSLIKHERQLRRLFTHLVYQSQAFNNSHVEQLRSALAKNRRVYADGFIKGFNALYSRTIKDLVGAEHDHLFTRLTEATGYRNKIFHGQLTQDALSRSGLLYVTDMKRWCELLAGTARAEFQYDGFGDSFLKSRDATLAAKLKHQFASVADYEAFILHRDIKPANILLELPSHRPKLIDFNISSPVRDATGQSLRGNSVS